MTKAFEGARAHLETQLHITEVALEEMEALDPDDEPINPLHAHDFQHQTMLEQLGKKYADNVPTSWAVLHRQRHWQKQLAAADVRLAQPSTGEGGGGSHDMDETMEKDDDDGEEATMAKRPTKRRKIPNRSRSSGRSRASRVDECGVAEESQELHEQLEACGHVYTGLDSQGRQDMRRSIRGFPGSVHYFTTLFYLFLVLVA